MFGLNINKKDNLVCNPLLFSRFFNFFRPLFFKKVNHFFDARPPESLIYGSMESGYHVELKNGLIIKFCLYNSKYPVNIRIYKDFFISIYYKSNFVMNYSMESSREKDIFNNPLFFCNTSDELLDCINDLQLLLSDDLPNIFIESNSNSQNLYFKSIVGYSNKIGYSYGFSVSKFLHSDNNIGILKYKGEPYKVINITEENNSISKSFFSGLVIKKLKKKFKKEFNLKNISFIKNVDKIELLFDFIKNIDIKVIKNFNNIDVGLILSIKSGEDSIFEENIIFLNKDEIVKINFNIGKEDSCEVIRDSNVSIYSVIEKQLYNYIRTLPSDFFYKTYKEFNLDLSDDGNISDENFEIFKIMLF